MNTHEHSSPHAIPGTAPLRPATSEETLRTEKVQIERKSFVFALKENPRGRFLRITEDVGGRRDTIIIPATGLADFCKVIELMARQSAETPLQHPPASQVQAP